MPAFDLALGLRMIGRSAHMRHVFGFDVIRQLCGYVTGSVVREQPGL